MPAQRKPRITITCEKCGQPFETLVTQPRRFCSKACNLACGHLVPLATRTCRGCGQDFSAPRHERKRVYCSRKCANSHERAAYHDRQCRTCGKRIVTADSRNLVYCSRECFNAGKQRTERPCEHCGVSYMPNTPTQKFCTPTCQQVASRRRVTKQCVACGKPFDTLASREERTKYCGNACRLGDVGHSNEEDYAVQIVADLLGEAASRQHWFPWLISSVGRRLYLDAYFPAHNVAIEYDGRQHREYTPFYHQTVDDFRRLQERDVEKDELLSRHGVTLIRIRDDEPRTIWHIASRLSTVRGTSVGNAAPAILQAISISDRD